MQDSDAKKQIIPSVLSENASASSKSNLGNIRQVEKWIINKTISAVYDEQTDEGVVRVIVLDSGERIETSLSMPWLILTDRA